jgi:hypothetical protein
MADTLHDKLTGIATLGTRRAPLPKDLAWPDPSLSALDAQSPAPETRLLRTVAAHTLYDSAGVRAAAEDTSGAATDFPAPGAPLISEPAAWRLARIVSGEHSYLLPEWFTMAAATGRVLPPHWLPMVLENVPAARRAGAGGVLGPAARWLASRHTTWTAVAPVGEFSDAAWQEGTTPERVAMLSAVRASSTERSRAWLRTTWDTDPPDAREAFLQALLPTVETADEEILELALDDKRKAVRQMAAEGLARLPESAHAARSLARAEPLVSMAAESGGLLAKLRKRKLAMELPTAPDKVAQRDGIELKVPAARKIGERAFWMSQIVAFVPPRHWCRKFSCDAGTFLDAAWATDFKNELLDALTVATARHPDPEFLRLLVVAWTESSRGAEMHDAIQMLVNAVPAAQRASLAETLLDDGSADKFGVAIGLLESLELHWSAALTRAAFQRLETMTHRERATYPQPRNRLDAWARHCDVAEGRERGEVLLGVLGESHSWRNALEQFNEIVAFRAAMQEELRP